MTPKGVTSHTSLMLTALSIRRRTSLSAQMMLAICKPAMLKAFEGELSTTQLSRHASETDAKGTYVKPRSEEHTSELQSRQYLVCRLLLEKKKDSDQAFR